MFYFYFYFYFTGSGVWFCTTLLSTLEFDRLFLTVYIVLNKSIRNCVRKKGALVPPFDKNVLI
jgi:hypothetical protein